MSIDHMTGPAKPKTSSLVVGLAGLAGAGLGALAAILLTRAWIEGDPSSTAALAYVFTIPVGLVIGFIVPVVVGWQRGNRV